MNFFLMKRFIDAIKSGKPIMYYNIETTGEEEKKRFLNTFHKNEKSVLDDRVFKLHDYKFKNVKPIYNKYEPNLNKEKINVIE